MFSRFTTTSSACLTTLASYEFSETHARGHTRVLTPAPRCNRRRMVRTCNLRPDPPLARRRPCRRPLRPRTHDADPPNHAHTPYRREARVPRNRPTESAAAPSAASIAPKAPRTSKKVLEPVCGFRLLRQGVEPCSIAICRPWRTPRSCVFLSEGLSLERRLY